MRPLSPITDEDRKLLGDLAELGLTRSEARVYLALVATGETSAGPLVLATQLHRQVVYRALERLEQLDLAGHTLLRGRKRFLAAGPKSLLRIARRQELAAAGAAAEIGRRYAAPADDVARTIRGKESYEAHEFEMLERASTGSTLSIIGGEGDLFVATMGARLPAYEALRRKKRVRVRYIGGPAQEKELRRLELSRVGFSARILRGMFNGTVNTTIWPDAVCFNAYGTPVTSFVIEDGAVAQGYAQFFETLWKLAA